MSLTEKEKKTKLKGVPRKFFQDWIEGCLPAKEGRSRSKWCLHNQ
jgi:hypothetical protein